MRIIEIGGARRHRGDGEVGRVEIVELLGAERRGDPPGGPSADAVGGGNRVVARVLGVNTKPMHWTDVEVRSAGSTEGEPTWRHRPQVRACREACRRVFPMADQPPKKKLVAMIKPPPNIGEMSQEELREYADQTWEQVIKPALDKAKAERAQTPQDEDQA